jgi:hypothetical protein
VSVSGSVPNETQRQRAAGHHRRVLPHRDPAGRRSR